MNKATIELEETNAIGDQLEVTLRGSVATITRVLVQGMPREAAIQMRDALQAELDKRSASPVKE